MTSGRMLRGLTGLGATIYYVDASLGNDGNGGLAKDDAWQTLGQVNGFAFADGDFCLFKRGEIFRGELDPSIGGAAGRHVVFDAYDAGADPIITGAPLITTWTPTVGDEFSAVCTFNPGHVYADNLHLTLGAAAGALNADEYFWVGNVLHVRLTSGDDPDLHVMEAVQNVYNIEVRFSYLTFRNLYCDKCNAAGIYASWVDPNLTNITFENVTSIRAGQEGFRINGGGGGNKGPNNVTLTRCTVSLWDRSNSTIYPAIYQREGDGSGGDGLVVTWCVVNGWITGPDSNNQRDGIRVDGGSGITLTYNEITGSDHGITLQSSCAAWEVAYNFLYDIGDDAFYLFNVDDATGRVHHNICNNIGDNFIDLATGNGNFGTFDLNTFYNAANWGISIRGTPGMTATIEYNVFGIAANPSQHFYLIYDVTGTQDITDFAIDYNSYQDYVDPPGTALFALYESAANKSWAQWQALGLDLNSTIVT